MLWVLWVRLALKQCDCFRSSPLPLKTRISIRAWRQIEFHNVNVVFDSKLSLAAIGQVHDIAAMLAEDNDIAPLAELMYGHEGTTHIHHLPGGINTSPFSGQNRHCLLTLIGEGLPPLEAVP